MKTIYKIFYITGLLSFCSFWNPLRAQENTYYQFESDPLPVYERILRIHKNNTNDVEGYHQALGILDLYTLENRDQFVERTQKDMVQGEYSPSMNDIKYKTLHRMDKLQNYWPLHKYETNKIKGHHNIFGEVKQLLEKDFEKIERQAQEHQRYTQARSDFMKMITLPTPKGEESINDFYKSINMNRKLITDEFFETAMGESAQDDLYNLEKKLLETVGNATNQYHDELEELYRTNVTSDQEFKKGKNRLKMVYQDITQDIRYISGQALNMHSKMFDDDQD